MLLTFFPPTNVSSAICPFIVTKAILFLINKLTLVCNPTIRNEEPVACHLVLHPLAMVGFAIPCLFAKTAYLTVFPLTSVDCSILIGILTLSVLHALLKFSLVFGTAQEMFYSFAMLQISLPLA